MRRLPLTALQPGAPSPGAPAAGVAQTHPMLRLQQAVGNRAAAAGALDAPALETLPAAPAVRTPATKPVPCKGCVGGGKGPVVRR